MQLFQRSDQLESPVMKEIVTEIRNSKKEYEDELKVSKEESTKTSAKRVTKKKIFETAFKVEKSLKKKLIDTALLVTLQIIFFAQNLLQFLVPNINTKSLIP